MEGMRINELLANGYFKTRTAKNPEGRDDSRQPLPSFLTADIRSHSRSRSRARTTKPPPPRPTVEEEHVSLARESKDSVQIPSYDPPLRGTADQFPVILEADVGQPEREFLERSEGEVWKDKHGNPERRFVFIPREDESESEGGHKGDAGVDGEADRERRFVFIPREESGSGSDGRKTGLNGQTERQDTEKEGGNGSRYQQGRYDPRREEKPRPTRQELPRQDSRREHLRREPSRHESRRDARSEKPTRQETSGRDVKIEQLYPPPPLQRQRSRQDLPTLETKVPREIPPKFRRSASASALNPKDHDETPKASTPATLAGEYFLSPEAIRGPKDHFSQSVPRQQVHDLLWGKTGTPTDGWSSGNLSGSRPGTPSSEKKHSGSHEKLTRPQQLMEETDGQRERRHSPERLSGRSSRSSAHRKSYYSSSDDGLADDSSEKHRRLHPGPRREENHRRSPSISNRSSTDLNSSRLSSPQLLPNTSPSQLPRGEQVERAETFPQSVGRAQRSRTVSPHFTALETPRADHLNPMDTARPKSRQSSEMPHRLSATHHPPLPIPIPSRVDLHSPGDIRRSPALPQYEEPSRSGSWQPPAWQPPTSSSEQPVGSYRRYSQDIEKGSVTPLPKCPRMRFTRDRDDWLTLPRCPGFDICPSCFDSIIAPTEFRNLFIQAPRRSPDVEVLCDFGTSPWYRIAWLLTLKERRRDLNLFYGLANISNKYPPCLGSHEAVRHWHSVIDHKTGLPVRGFDVCYSCVKSVETLLPAIHGVFVRTDRDAPPTSRICDLRFDSKRFVQYFDALETAADRASYHSSPPDTRELASLARRLALFPECPRDRDLPDRRWHVIAQLPEFTVCEECFDDVVWPELEEGKAIPRMFGQAQRLEKASCQLYSSRMRGVFRLAVDSGDYLLLAGKARERKRLEREWKGNLEIVKRGGGGSGVEREVERMEAEWRRWEARPSSGSLFPRHHPHYLATPRRAPRRHTTPTPLSRRGQRETEREREREREREMPYARQLDTIFAHLSSPSPSEALARRHPCAAREDFDAVCAAFLQAEAGLGGDEKGLMREVAVFRAEWNVWAYYFGEHEPFPGINPTHQDHECDSGRAVPPSCDIVPEDYTQERNRPQIPIQNPQNDFAPSPGPQDHHQDLGNRHHNENGHSRPALGNRDANANANADSPRESYLTRIIRERVEKRGRRFLGRQLRPGERERSMSPRSRPRQQREREGCAREEGDGYGGRYEGRYQDHGYEHEHGRRAARERDRAGGDGLVNQQRRALVGGRRGDAESGYGVGDGDGERRGGEGAGGKGEERRAETRENDRHGWKQSWGRNPSREPGRGRASAFNTRLPPRDPGQVRWRERASAAHPSAPPRSPAPTPARSPSSFAGVAEPRDQQRHRRRGSGSGPGAGRARGWEGGWKANTYRPREREDAIRGWEGGFPGARRLRSGFGGREGDVYGGRARRGGRGADRGRGEKGGGEMNRDWGWERERHFGDELRGLDRDRGSLLRGDVDVGVDVDEGAWFADADADAGAGGDGELPDERDGNRFSRR
ncbi:unnamed protein product [Diplocarpon coronariae]